MSQQPIWMIPSDILRLYCWQQVQGRVKSSTYQAEEFDGIQILAPYSLEPCTAPARGPGRARLGLVIC